MGCTSHKESSGQPIHKKPKVVPEGAVSKTDSSGVERAGTSLEDHRMPHR